MWAVGRLSLLSRGLGHVKTAPGAEPVAARGNNPKSVQVSVHEPAPAPVNESETQEAKLHGLQPNPVNMIVNVDVHKDGIVNVRELAPVPPPGPEPAPLGVIQRVFTRVKSFFRSIFG